MVKNTIKIVEMVKKINSVLVNTFTESPMEPSIFKITGYE